MELFDKKFVYFMWDDSLEGKEGFYADHIDSLIDYVEYNSLEHKGCVKRNCMNDAYPFNIVQSGNSFRFFYYDPNHSCKVAYMQGKKIQCKLKDSPFRWEDCIDKPKWLDTCEYRVKPEKKWRPFKDIVELKNTFLSMCYPKGAEVLKNKFMEPAIWVRDKERPDITRLITGFNGGSKCVAIAGEWRTLEALFEQYEFLDGTPCGVEEVE